jgi:hypothetical protein
VLLRPVRVDGRKVAQIDPLFLEPTNARSARHLQFTLRLNW